MKRFASLLFAFVLMATALPWASSAAAESPKFFPEISETVRYFPQTGHNLGFGFLTYWKNHGGLDQFGFPITEEFQQVSPTDGKTYTVQFFERAVFEYHPEFAPGPYETELRLLGKLASDGRTDDAFKPTAAFPSSNDRWYFPETGHSLNFGFKYYWEAHGGLDIFGYPISEEFSEVSPTDGKTYTVQYFERGRFEYHPEFKLTPYETELGLLGSEHARTSNLDPSHLVWAAPMAAPRPDGPAPFPLAGPHIGYGMNAQLYFADRSRVLSLVKDAGFGWVKQQVTWYDIEGARGEYAWGELDRVVNDAYANGVNLTLSVTRSPSWATSDGGHGMPADPNDLGNFMKAMAGRYRGKVAAYEIWNEQNTGGETNGHVDAGRYVELLKAGFTGVKASDPWAIVLYGGLTPNGVNDPSLAIDDKLFLQQTYQYQNGVVKNYFDALGAHPGSNANSPDQLWPDNPGPGPGWTTDRSFYFRRIEDLRDVMVNNGDGNKQIWLTEFGWTTANQAPGYEYGAQISDQLQAQYLVRAYQKAKAEYPWMGVMNLWNLNFSTVVPPSDEKYPWSVINGDWSPRPAYTALQNMPK